MKLTNRLRKVFRTTLLCALALSVVMPAELLYALPVADFPSQKIGWLNPSECIPAGGNTPTAAVTGATNAAKIWNYLQNEGLKDFQIAGVLGNIAVESGHSYSPNMQEKAKTFPSGGYGLVQWTGSRRTTLVERMRVMVTNFTQYYTAEISSGTFDPNTGVMAGVPVEVNDDFLSFQMRYLVEESKGRSVRQGYGPAGSTEWDALLATTSLKAASDLWLFSFERPGDQSASHAQRRAESGQKIWDALKVSSGANSSTNQSATTPNTGSSTSTQTPSSSPSTTKYLTSPVGTVPAEGIEVGASTFGGEYDKNSQQFVSTNDVQGVAPGHSRDDNGKGDGSGGGIAGHVAYAELAGSGGIGTALGKLPPLTKLEITYNGKSVIAERRDVGLGQPGHNVEGKPIVIDLWWEAAKLLDFKSGNGLVKIRPVDPSTPATPVSGAANNATSDSSTATACVCPDPAAGTTGATVFIDPGHGAAISKYIDEKSGLAITESYNAGETEDVLEVSQQAKTQLEQAGYKVILGRNDNSTPVKFRGRADMAVNAKAAIGVSVHTDAAVNQAWPQRMGKSRSYGGKTTTFSNQDTATKSEQYAKIFADTRKGIEGREVGLDPNNSQQYASFHREGIESTGNIPIIPLFADTVPWVYNEMATGGGKKLSNDLKQKYVQGLVDSVKKSIPVAGATNSTETSPNCSGSGSAATGEGFSSKVLAYAWPDHKGRGFTQKKPEYQTAINEAKKQGMYVGGCDGVDCGAFVTRLVMDSGFDPTYNSNGKGGATPEQRKWLDANWQRLGDASTIDTATLRPGDVAWQPGHTFIYVGTVPGFNSKIASASLCSRAPMAGKEALTFRGIIWYRKK